MSDYDFSRYGLVERMYAAAHDVDPGTVDRSDGSYADCERIFIAFEDLERRNLASLLGIDRDSDDEEIIAAIDRLCAPSTASRLIGPQSRRIGLLSVTLRRLADAVDADWSAPTPAVRERLEQAREVLADNTIVAERSRPYNAVWGPDVDSPANPASEDTDPAEPTEHVLTPENAGQNYDKADASDPCGALALLRRLIASLDEPDHKVLGTQKYQNEWGAIWSDIRAYLAEVDR